MKLLIVGANGFVAKEVLRQSLRMPDIDTVLALSRKATVTPNDLYPNSDISKFRSLVVEDYDVYNEETRAAFAGVDACIWTVAITPSKSKQYSFEEVSRVCYDCTVKGLQAIIEARSHQSTPLRFMYMSGFMVDRDPDRKYEFMHEYGTMRSKTERILIEMATQSSSNLEVSAARPGLITGLGDPVKPVPATGPQVFKGVPSLGVDQCAAAMLHEVLHGFSKDPLLHDDLVRIGDAQLAGSV